jgi:hypothetical protein
VAFFTHRRHPCRSAAFATLIRSRRRSSALMAD